MTSHPVVFVPVQGGTPRRLDARPWLPPALTTLRLLLAPALLGMAWRARPGWSFALVLTAGLLSDVYDGVLARRWGVATATLRRFDSLTDVAFYASVLAAAWHLHRATVARWPWAVGGLLALEGAVQVTSLVRWRTVQATHSNLAKVWGLTLWVAFASLLGLGIAGPFAIALGVGFAADLEVLAILLIAPGPPVDVRTAAAAWRLRVGRTARPLLAAGR